MLPLLGRWLIGTGLVSWRYLWMTTPLHREECRGDSDDDLPPRIPRDLLDQHVQLAGGGVGPLFHRRFTVHIVGSERSAEDLVSMVVSQFARFVPSEVVGIAREEDGRLQVGEEFVVEMPGPWNGPVRVLEVQPDRLRLVTLEGHLECGQVQFSARQDDCGLVFEVETWARSASASVQLLYAHLRLAKEVQFNMWVRFCLAAARHAGGRPQGGLKVRTRTVPEEALPFSRLEDGRDRLTEGPLVPVRVFAFRFAPSYRPAAAAFGVTPGTAQVSVTPQELRVRFGPWHLRTPRSNIASVQQTGGFTWPKTAGPAHLSLVDRGITFATNGDRGLCVQFHEPVPAMEPTGRLRHPGMTVTVQDPEALAEALG